MAAYEWPGNVRELRNFIESLVVLDNDGILDVNDVQDDDFLPGLANETTRPTPTGAATSLVGRPLAEVERYYIEQALDLTSGNREEAAKLLQYQQAYQASAKMLQIAQGVFDALLQSLGR